MAASVVDKLLAGSLISDEVVKWICHQLPGLGVTGCECTRAEFLPFFLNYVHDQFSNRNFTKSQSKNDDAPSAENVLHEIKDNTNEFMTPSNNLDESISPSKLLKASGKPTKSGGRNNVKLTKLGNSPRNMVSQNVQAVPNIQDLDAFPPIGSGTSKIRRITPTPVQKLNPQTSKITSIPEVFGNQPDTRTSQPIFSSTPLKENKDDNLKDRHEWLRERLSATKSKYPKEASTGFTTKTNSPKHFIADVPKLQVNKSSATVTSPPKDKSLNKIMTPAFKCVTDRNKLDAIIKIYCACLHENLVPNVNIELYFLIQVLTVKVTSSTKIPKEHLASVHNCVYLATQVLEKQSFLLNFFDNSALKMLLNVPFLSEFSLPLYEMLVKFKNSIEQISSWKISHLKGVPFQDGIDNRENFPSTQSFNVFRRQRDLFYDLLREWQKKNLTDGSMTPDTFTRKVNAIVQQGRNPINQVHLARLLVSQLLQSCCDCEEFSLQGGVDEDSLAELKQMYPEKFSKLNQRLSAPSLQGNPSPTPLFHGIQGFFHDFLQYSDSAMFHRHVIDVLLVELKESNNSDIFDLDSGMGQEEHEVFFLTVHTLRLLGKFLGYLIFYPYQSSIALSNQVTEELKHLRTSQVLQIDLQDFLQEAIAKQKLVLTVPWVVEFLSMSDSITLNLPSCHIVVNTLVHVYHTILQIIENSYSKVFLQLLLGYLFEMPFFPQSVFFNYCPGNLKPKGYNNPCLDEAKLVDQKLIISCCPYVQAINCVLKQYLSGDNSKTKEVRKITPIAAEHSKIRSSQVSVQQKLEENFFHHQSASVKRTVDFVADRVASRLIKHISNVIISSAKSKELTIIKTKLQNSNKRLQKSECNIPSLSVQLCQSVWEECEKYITEHGKCLVKQIMPLLLAEDSSEEVNEVCCQVAYRISSAKVNQWVYSNVTVEYFSGELSEQITQIFGTKENDSDVYDVQKHSDEYHQAICALQEIILSLHNQDVITKGKILSVLDLIAACCPVKSQDLVYKHMSNFYSDFITAVIIFCPTEFNNEVSEKSLALLQNFPNCSVIQRLICPRNILLLNLANNSSESWSKVAETISSFISKELLKMEDFLSNCTKIMKQKSVCLNSSVHLLQCIEKVLNNFPEAQSEVECLRKMMTNLHC